MANYAVKQIDEMEAIYAGTFKRARAELGVEAFGLQVLDLPPGIEDGYPEHDHSEDGQEEVYVPMSGSGHIDIDGQAYDLSPGLMVRVGPGVKRKLRTGDDALRVLIIGGVAGEPYEAPDVTQLGEPDPLAQRQAT